jgi:RhtB (resistance to homoserine/threonine) family protein
MDDYWIEFGKVAAAHLLAVVSPGPDFAVVLRQSLGYGRRIAIWTSIGIGTAILLHASYSLLGIGLLVRGSAGWFNTLKFAGAAYLGWIGLQALRARREDSSLNRGVNSLNPPAWRTAFLLGFLTNALNPKATLFFIALFATVISGQTPRWILAGYGMWMSVATMGWFCLVSVLVTREGVRRKFLSNGHWVSRVLGVVLLGFAVSLVLTQSR